VTAIHFAPGATSLPADAAASLAPVAGVLAKAGGRVHVVSHAVSGNDATASLAAYQTALARAKAIQQDLVATGIPEAKIATEVSSSITSEANDTAEVLVGK
jgi:outer membrane protein OmpA-like peptidoglycan-associated protein